MSENRYKFDKISDLIIEIDKTIKDLSDKRQELIDKIKGDKLLVSIVWSKDKGKYETDAEGNVTKRITIETAADQDKITTYSTAINTFVHKLLNEEAKKAKTNVSTFLKNKYFLPFLNSDNKSKDYALNYAKIQAALGPKLEISGLDDRKSAAMALNKHYSDRLERTLYELHIPKRDLIRYIINLFVYDKLVNKKIPNDYVLPDKDINYVKCDRSSNVKAYGYDIKKKQLFIEFRGGDKYQYFDVPLSIYESLLAADSKGKYVNENIAHNYKYVHIY